MPDIECDVELCVHNIDGLCDADEVEMTMLQHEEHPSCITEESI